MRTAVQLWDGRLVEALHAMFVQTVAHALDTDCDHALTNDEARGGRSVFERCANP
jgi:hypothetical protein